MGRIDVKIDNLMNLNFQECIAMIESRRLILKPVTSEDIDIYMKIMSDVELTRYLPKGKPYTRQEIESHVRCRSEHWSKGFGSYVITLKSDPELKIGYVGVEMVSNTDCCDIRYSLLKAFSGRGYAFEAAKTCLSHTFDSGLIEKVYGVAVTENTPSVNIIKKLGMRPEPSARLYDEDNLVTFSIRSSER